MAARHAESPDETHGLSLFVLVAVTTLSFDIAGLEMLLPLWVGARLVVASRQTTQDGHLLIRLLRDSRATVLQATPATWRLLFECDWKGNRNLKVLVGGEALSPELARRLVSSCREVWNMYGPTETTIWSSVYRVHGREERSVPIGKAIANTTLYILDANQQPVPAGSEGELYIAGEGLARGYFNRPELTAEKFLPDPFSSRPAARIYRTGDRLCAKWAMDAGRTKFSEGVGDGSQLLFRASISGPVCSVAAWPN